MSLEEILSFFRKTSSVENIVLGVAASLVMLGFQQVFIFTRNKFGVLLSSINKGFTLSGFWITITFRDHKKRLIKHIDIIEIKDNTPNIKVVIWHYGSMYKNKNWYKYYGEGIKKGQSVSVYYYLDSDEYPETGCAILRLEGAKLVGPYVQYIANDVDSGLMIQEDYCLRRINLSFKIKMRMFFARPPFKSYSEVKAFTQLPIIYND